MKIQTTFGKKLLKSAALTTNSDGTRTLVLAHNAGHGCLEIPAGSADNIADGGISPAAAAILIAQTHAFKK